MKSIRPGSKTYIAAIMWGVFILSAINVSAGKPLDPFPVYPSLKSNVAFWKQIYGTYSTSQGILHDRRNLDIIYDIIELKDPKTPGAAKFNSKKVKQIKIKYERLLKTVATGKPPVSDEEKRICDLFTQKKSQGLLRDAHLNVRFQLGQKDRFRAGLIRSGAYLDEIRSIFKQYGLPLDLAYLPHVESSFDYKAYSKFGAAGIWQFTWGTGKKYMTVDYTVDERRDPILATHAAAQFLKKNHDILGNWPMAVTAYNHGPSGMLRAKKTHGDHETVLNCYNGSTFGFASRNFYSEFLAAREIAKNHQRYFSNLEFDSPVRRHTLKVPGYVAWQDLMRHFQVDENTLKKLNPALREPVFNGQKYVPKGFLLHLPQSMAANPYSARFSAEMIKNRQKPSRFYRVRKGDTVGQIARQHKVRINDLILANGLNSRATIYSGQNLRIPVPGEKIILVAATKVQGRPKAASPMVKPVQSLSEPTVMASASPQKPALKVETPKPAAVSATEPPAPVTEDESEQLLPDDSISPSSEISQVNPAVVTGSLSVEQMIVRGNQAIGVIQVEPEETLGHYADWLQIPTRQIRRLNHFSFKRQIHVGQKIEIPFGNITREQFEEKRYEYHKEIEEDFFAVYSVKKTMAYRIQSGDNIWTLCQKKFELPFWLLRKYNPELDFDRLSDSEKLIIPVVSTIGETSEPVILEENGNGNGEEYP
jgi:membrane-bound lytic murein transglycosylase D